MAHTTATRPRTRRHRGTRSRRRGHRGTKLPIWIAAAAGVVLIIALVVFLGGRIIAGQRKDKLENTVVELEYSLDSLDADSMLSILNPEIADPIRLLLAVSGYSGTEAMEELLVQLTGSDQMMDSLSEISSSMDAEILDEQIQGKWAYVDTRCSFVVRDQTFARYITFYMSYIEDQWYIMDAEVSVTDPTA